MATVIGDPFPDPSRFHAMIANANPSSSLSQPNQHQHQHQHHHQHQQQPPLHPHTHCTSALPSPPPPAHHSAATAPARTQRVATPPAWTGPSLSWPTTRPHHQQLLHPNTTISSSSSSTSNPSTTADNSSTEYSHTHKHSSALASASASSSSASASTSAPGWAPAAPWGETHASAGGGASRFPSPPSSSPAVTTDDANVVSMASQTARHHVSIDRQQRSAAPAAVPDDSSSYSAPAVSTRHHQTNNAQQQQQQQQPSPPSDDFNPTTSSSSVPAAAGAVDSSHASGAGAAAGSLSSPSPQQTVIHIRDLAHVQSLARADMRAGHGSGILNDPPLQQMKYEISAMPIGDIIEMVAALLTKITTTNDLQHDAMQRNVTHQQQASQNSEAAGSSQMSPLSHSVLAFHGKNVPAITILSYLARIHKYCPTTYEVFLSLLVYFDRMTERVNELVTKSEEARRQSVSTMSRQPSQQNQRDTPMRDDGVQYEMDDSDSDLADDDEVDDDDDDDMDDSPAASARQPSSRPTTARSEQPSVAAPATYFVVDSFNIHRLIIAGVTCASKFFSDVFYTNSRYAKVGGLPLAELNHLELQFLVLNEFRLFVPVEDLEAYATMLVEFYAREVVGRQPSVDSRE